MNTTPYRDDNARLIMTGDILACKDGYKVLVCKDKTTGDFYGSLICPLDDSCRSIPYHLNNGIGHIIICNTEVKYE